MEHTKIQDLIKEESSSANFQHNLFSAAMQGWQCPICKRVYSSLQLLS